MVDHLLFINFVFDNTILLLYVPLVKVWLHVTILREVE